MERPSAERMGDLFDAIDRNEGAGLNALDLSKIHPRRMSNDRLEELEGRCESIADDPRAALEALREQSLEIRHLRREAWLKPALPDLAGLRRAAQSLDEALCYDAQTGDACGSSGVHARRVEEGA